MKIVLAIPTYNRAKHLGELLPLVLKQGFYKVYVLDDNSSDNTPIICQKYPEVTVIRGDENIGPAGNRNRVLDQDLGDAVFFLDDDVRLETSNVPLIVENILRGHPETAIVSARIFSKDGKQVTFSYDQESNPLFRWLEQLFTMHKLPPVSYDKPYVSVAWVLENAFAIRTNVFKSLGGFDAVYRKFQEGPDLCKRTLLAGYAVAITNKMEATHTEPYSVSSLNQLPAYIRASVIWYYKHAFRFNKPRKT